SGMPFRLDCIKPEIYYHEVEISYYPVFKHPPYDLALAAKMAEVIDREKLDILHVHYAMHQVIRSILAKYITKHDVKIITTQHRTDITVLGMDKTFKPMIKYGIDKSDKVTAVSQNLADQTKKVLEVDREIDVIYNFINDQDYYKKDREYLKPHYDIASDERVIIHISNFRKVKRIQDVIKTFAKIQNKVKSKLILVGDGPESPTAFDMVDQLNINDKVIFLGRQKNISDLLSISDLLLLMSEQESFGLVILEAMASEVPTIGTNVGGIPEVINHNETGYLVDLGDTNKAADYAINLLKDSNKLSKMSQLAYERSKTKFHSTTIVNQYLELYKSVLNNK